MSQTKLALIASALALVALLACSVAGYLLAGALNLSPSASASAEADARIVVSTRCLIGCGVDHVSVSQEQQPKAEAQPKPAGVSLTGGLVAVGVVAACAVFAWLRNAGEQADPYNA